MDDLIAFTIKEFIKKYGKEEIPNNVKLNEIERRFTGSGVFVEFETPNNIITDSISSIGGDISFKVNNDIFISSLFYIKNGCLAEIEFVECSGES